MAKRTASGRVKLAEPIQREVYSTPKEEVRSSDKKEDLISTPEGYRFSEEVASPSPDYLRAEEAPKARTEDQFIGAPPTPPAMNLSPDSLTLANLTLGTANATVVMMFGQECALYDGEKKLLYPSLARVINRMPAASAAKASVFIDPIVLLLGLGIWVNRIVVIKSQQRTAANQITAREFANASGINWDANKQQAGDTGPNTSAPGPTGTGAASVPPEAPVNPVNANGIVGGVPNEIINSRNTDITGPG